MSNLIKSVLLLMLFVSFGCSQKTSKPTAYDQLIEEGYEVLLSDTLKTAQNEFVVVVLKDVAEDSLMFASNATVQRPLLILEKQHANIFDITLRNDNAILCANYGGIMGNPFEGIEIRDNMIIINHSGGSRYRWTRNVGFTYSPKEDNWLLSSDQGVSFDSMNPEEEFEEVMYTMINPTTKIRFEDFNIYQD